MNGIFLAALCSLCGFLVGLALQKRCVEREIYYRDAVRLCAHLINNISFRSEKITTILASAELDSAPLKKNVEEFEVYVSGGELAISGNCLTKGEATSMREFFAELGKYDGETQLNELRRREGDFRQIHAALKAKNDAQGNMYTKLGLLTGLLVGILLI